MRDELWAILGAVPKDKTTIIIMRVFNGPRAEAEKARAMAVQKYFPGNETQVMCEMIDLLSRKPHKVRAILKKYFEKLGIPYANHEKLIASFADQFLALKGAVH